MYNAGDSVRLWVNKIGPYHNPQETYTFFSLPFCTPSSMSPHELEETKFIGLGDLLEGNELKHWLDFKFKTNVEHEKICTMTLDAAKIAEFAYAIANHYWYQCYIDDLPSWGMVGEVISPNFETSDAQQQVLIFTHKQFSIGFNGNQVIQVNLSSENPEPLERNRHLDFTYSVKWVPVDIPFASRFDRYLDYNFFEHQIHWFSIFNSFVMVIFLVGFVAIILMRTLSKDYAKYTKDDEGFDAERDGVEDSGWKQVHGDVFRAPPYLITFSALYGTGAQLSLLVFLIILEQLASTFTARRGDISTSFIACYALTSVVGGYIGGGYYMRCNGPWWIKTLFLTSALFPGICFLIASVLNVVAYLKNSLAVIPVWTMVVMILLWALVVFPLTIVGTVLGRRLNGRAKLPCRVNPIPRPIPEKKSWYSRQSVIICLGGLLPFFSIFIEMYFIFSSFWNYKFYYVYGFLLLVYFILIIVTVCMSIVGTYFMLNGEDYRFPWASFLAASSTAVYMYLYSIYYFFFWTKMSGFFQTAVYFGYMAMFSVGLGTLCGSIGFCGASIFVQSIFKNIKSD